MTYSAVLFDLDGTLCTNSQSVEAIYDGAFETTGIEPFGDPEDLWAALDDPPAPDDEAGYLAAGFAKVAAQYGRAPVDVVALGRGFLQCADHSQVSPRAGAERVLEAAQDVPLGVVTNGPKARQAEKLEALPFDDLFEAVVFAGDLERRKPHAEPFERALSAIEAVPSETLFVGNSLEYDVAGAQNAGLPAAWCPVEPEPPEPYRPDHVLESLTDLEEVLGL